MPDKTCFVVMGFGKKTDYATGRVLDLDKSYRNIIKPAAIAAGLMCTRADEIIHAGVIDVPMYEQLLMADVVVADVSTYNCNAFYELGVRHALRPHTTITIAEDKMVYPFDVSHIVVRKYRHLGEGIDFDEVERMRQELKTAMEIIASKPQDDSPVYTFLKDLKPPMRAAVEALAAAAPASTPAPTAANNPTVSVLMGEAESALAKSDFVTARSLLTVVRSMIPFEPYVVQRLALATYKSQTPTPQQALEDAGKLLAELQPEISTDTETLGLWGSMHKRMWDLTTDPAHLDIAIFSYEKGFYLKNDYYNGINLAYLYNVRAARSAGPEAITDFVLAQRTRRQVIRLGEALPEGYWVLATMAEAWLGLGEKAKAQEYLDRAFQLQPAPAEWMKATTQKQLESLAKLLEDSPLKNITA